MEPLRCKMCNGPLIMDESEDYVVCEYCGTKFAGNALKKMMKIELSGPIHIQGEEVEDQLKKVKTFVSLKQKHRALDMCESIITKDPSDYRGWWYRYITATDYLDEDKIDYESGEEIAEILQKLDRNAYESALPVLTCVENYLDACNTEKPQKPEPNFSKWMLVLAGAVSLIALIYTQFKGSGFVLALFIMAGVSVPYVMRYLKNQSYIRALNRWNTDLYMAKKAFDELKKTTDLYTLQEKTE